MQMNLRPRSLTLGVEQNLRSSLRVLGRAVPRVRFAKVLVFENHYEIWGPASRLSPDIAKQIEVCTHARVCKTLVQVQLPKLRDSFDTGYWL